MKGAVQEACTCAHTHTHTHRVGTSHNEREARTSLLCGAVGAQARRVS